MDVMHWGLTASVIVTLVTLTASEKGNLAQSRRLSP